MRMIIFVVPLLVASAPVAPSALLAAWPDTAQAPGGGAPQLPRGQVPDRGRPTLSTDEMPLFDFDQYFPGKWTFEWDVPDGPLGPDGTHVGTIVYSKIDDRTYDALTTAKGPAGSYTVKERITYDRPGRKASRTVTDSRGFSYTQHARVGGDLGGYFTFYYESEPFTYQGRKVRIRTDERLLSPVRYRHVTTVSADDGPFLNYGSPWIEKEVVTPSKPRF